MASVEGGSFSEEGSGNTTVELETVGSGLTCVGKAAHVDSLVTLAEMCPVLFDLRHPHVIQYLGIFQPESRCPLVVMEYMPHSLDHVLKNTVNLPLGVKYSVLGDVARGLDYIHSRQSPIVHGRVTATNVLLSPGMVGKISDVGSCMHSCGVSSLSQEVLAYLPPEVQTANPNYTVAVDVFSFGHLSLYTLIQEFPTLDDSANTGGKEPRSEVERRARYIQKLTDQFCGANHPVVQLVNQCLQNDAQSRPTIGEVVQCLREKWFIPSDQYQHMTKLEMIVMMNEMKNHYQGLIEAYKAQHVQDTAKIQDLQNELKSLKLAHGVSSPEISQPNYDGEVKEQCDIPTKEPTDIQHPEESHAEMESSVDLGAASFNLEKDQEAVPLAIQVDTVQASEKEDTIPFTIMVDDKSQEMENEKEAIPLAVMVDASQEMEKEEETPLVVLDSQGMEVQSSSDTDTESSDGSVSVSDGSHPPNSLEQWLPVIAGVGGTVLKDLFAGVQTRPQPPASPPRLYSTRLQQLTHYESKEMTYACVYCGAVFQDENLLQLHEHAHTEKAPFTCGHCRATFPCVGDLKLHVVEHLQEKPFPCTRCDAKFSQSSELLQHLRTHNVKKRKKFSCSHCSAVFDWPSKLERHLSSVHTKKAPRTHCKKSRGTQCNLLEQPAEVKAQESVFSCRTCEAKFPQKNLLRKHVLVHSADKVFACTLCVAAFKLPGNLESHVREHCADTPFSCTKCKAKFTNHELLKEHMLEHKNDKHFSCSECEAVFAHSSDLQEHTRFHAEGKRFPCPHCKAEFARYVILQHHISTHKEERPYTCTICRSKFEDIILLRQHVNQHPKPGFSCNYCGWVCYDMNILQLHVLKHSQEKNPPPTAEKPSLPTVNRENVPAVSLALEPSNTTSSCEQGSSVSLSPS